MSSGRSVLWFKESPKPDRDRKGAGIENDDPSLLYSANSGYEELADLEGQRGMQTKREDLEEPMDSMTRTTVGVGNRVG